jgi:hypothetical protein
VRASWPRGERKPRTIFEADRLGWKRSDFRVIYERPDADAGVLILTKQIGNRKLSLNVGYRTIRTYSKPREVTR